MEFLTNSFVVAEASRCKPLDQAISDRMLTYGFQFLWPGLGKLARDSIRCALTAHAAQQAHDEMK